MTRARSALPAPRPLRFGLLDLGVAFTLGAIAATALCVLAGALS